MQSAIKIKPVKYRCWAMILLVAAASLNSGVIQANEHLNIGFSRSIIWLDVELARAGLPAAEYFFDPMAHVGKVSEVLLPVFFGKEDACLVTQKVFDIMAELNPQISRQLKIVAASKGYIPGFLAFRKNYKSKVQELKRGVICIYL